MAEYVANIITFVDCDNSDVNRLLTEMRDINFGYGALDFNKINLAVPSTDNATEESYTGHVHYFNGMSYTAYNYVVFMSNFYDFKNLIRKLSVLYPDITIEYEYASESKYSDYMGRYTYKNGDEIAPVYYPDNKEDSEKFYNYVWDTYKDTIHTI